MGKFSEETKERMKQRYAKLSRQSIAGSAYSLGTRALGLPVGTLASLLPGGAKPSMMEGISAAKAEIPDEGATFEDYHRAITAYQEPFEARKYYWGASELLGEALLPTGAPSLLGKGLIKAAPLLSKGFYGGASKVAPKRFKPPKWEREGYLKGDIFDKTDELHYGPYGETTFQAQPRSGIGKAATGLEETLTGVGESLKIPWELENMLGRQLVRPLAGIAKTIKGPKAIQQVDTELAPDLPLPTTPEPTRIKWIGFDDATPTPRQTTGGGKQFDSVVQPVESMDQAVYNTARDTSFGGIASKISQIPVVKQMLKGMNPSAIAKSANARGIIGRYVMLDQAEQRVQVAMASVLRIGNQESVLGKIGDNGLLIGDVNPSLRGLAPNDVRSNPTKYDHLLNTQQKEWIGEMRKVEEGIGEMFAKEGIEFKRLQFDEGGQVWAGRRVVKYGADGAAEVRYLKGRYGVKGITPMEKKRMFNSQAEALEAGYKYLPEDEALQLNLRAAYERVIDNDFAKWMKANVDNLEIVTKPSKADLDLGVRLPGKLGHAVYTGDDAARLSKELQKVFQPYDPKLGKLGSYEPTGVVPKTISLVAKVNTIGRYMMLNGDASPFMIQLLFLLGSSPKQWTKALNAFVRAFRDKRYHNRMIYENSDVIRNHPNMLISTMGSEMTEALDRGGILLSKYVRPITKMYVPFGRGFNAALDAAGIHMAKSLDDVLKTRNLSMAQRQQVDAFINEFRGMASTQRLGVSKQWKDVESALLLAPRYNRAIAALVTDLATDGGIRGHLARKAMRNSVTALIMASSAFSMIDYVKNTPEEKQSEEGMIQHIMNHINPSSPEFFTWKVGETNIGPGTKIRSLINLMAKVVDEPEKLLEMDYNPALNFVRGNLSPLASDAVDIVTGYNYIGEPTGFFDHLEDDLVTNVGQFSKEIIGPDLMPIWVQALLLEEGTMGQKVTMAGAEFFGMRAYPVSRKQLKDEEAKKRGYDNYEDLDRNIKALIDMEIDKVHGKDYRHEEGIKYEKQRDEVNEKFVDDLWIIDDKLLSGDPWSKEFTPLHARKGGFGVKGLNELKEERYKVLKGREYDPDKRRHVGGLDDKIYGDFLDEEKKKGANWGTREYNLERYYDLFDQASDEKGDIDWDHYRELEEKFWNSLSPMHIDELLRNIRVIEGEYPPSLQKVVNAGRYALTQKVELEGEKSTYYGLKNHKLVVDYIASQVDTHPQEVLAFLGMSRSEREVMAKQEPGKTMLAAFKKAEGRDGVLYKLRSQFIKDAPGEWLLAMFESGYSYTGDDDYNEVIYEKLRDGYSLPSLDYVDLLKGQLYPSKYKQFPDLTK